MAEILADIAKSLTQRFVAPYTKRLRESGFVPNQPKEINDSVWGTIALSPVEVAVLDSPILQRLRHLRQLGVAHWLYPGAAHSRFEHSLGVLHQTEELIGALNRGATNRYEREIIPRAQRDVLRLAALLHDIGHPVFSHVSEYALELDPATVLEIQRYKRSLGGDAKLSEIIASEIVRSKDFRDLLDLVLTIHAKMGVPITIPHDNLAKFTADVADCIIGKGISNTVPLLHEIISGPFDADKLDYMVRDAKAAGIPSIIDISRLIQKLTVRRLEKENLPKRIARNVGNSEVGYYLFGFTWSGISVLDELLLARMILYAKLYRHPKVAALEAMIRALVRQLSQLLSPAALVHFVYHVMDEELVLAQPDDLKRRLQIGESDLSDPVKLQAFNTCIELIERLRSRELFVRGFAFYTYDSDTDAETNEAFPFAKVVKLLSDRKRIEELRSDIIAETKHIIDLVGFDVGHGLNSCKIEDLLLVVRSEPPSQEELRHAFIFPSSGPPKVFGEMGIHKEAWSSSFSSGAPKGFVFCPRQIAEFVFLATETVIARMFDVAIPDWMLEEAKQSRARLRPIQLNLRGLGYYRDKPECIRPLAERLTRVDAENIIKEFARRFSAIQETLGPDAGAELSKESGFDLMCRRAYSWLDQFETDEFIECGLELLSRSRLLGRADTVAALRAFIGSNPKFAKASVIMLSKGAESSQIVQYYAADLSGELKFYTSLKEAVSEGRAEPIIFLDDFCGSGGQVTNIIATWFDKPDIARKDLHEQRSLALEPERDFLASKEIAFVFVVAWSDGLAAISKAADAVGMKVLAYAHVRDDGLPFAFNVVHTESSPEVWQRFEAKCAEIGVDLLKSEVSWDEEKRASRALGYGNRAMLLFFPYNTPSQTLTCMWAEGTVGGSKWTPIARRRKKVLESIESKTDPDHKTI